MKVHQHFRLMTELRDRTRVPVEHVSGDTGEEEHRVPRRSLATHLQPARLLQTLFQLGLEKRIEQDNDRQHNRRPGLDLEQARRFGHWGSDARVRANNDGPLQDELRLRHGGHGCARRPLRSCLPPSRR